jgi:hypothetical protein
MLGECPQRRETLVFCYGFQEQKLDKSIVLKLKELIIDRDKNGRILKSDVVRQT